MAESAGERTVIVVDDDARNAGCNHTDVGLSRTAS
jgi:hypothetical protein